MDPYIKPHANINSKWIKDLNVRPETVKLLEENIEEKLLDTDLGNGFWIWHQSHSQQKQKLTSGTTPKLKSFCKAKNNQQNERQPTEWEKIPAHHTPDKGLISKIYKELLQLNNNKTKQCN